MRFTISFLTAVVLALQANAANFVAFSGDSCDGSEGTAVGCNGECIAFSGRHSYQASTPTSTTLYSVANAKLQVIDGSASVVFFENGDCTGESFNFGTDSNTCINVNTGTTILSAICS